MPQPNSDKMQYLTVNMYFNEIPLIIKKEA